MLTRLRYAALLAGALLAIRMGLWPSLLTIGALVALPSAAFALTGVVAPAVVERHRWRRLLAAAGAVVFAVQSLLMAGIAAWDRRRPVVLVLDAPAPTRVRVVYAVSDGLPRRLAWERRFPVPASGIVHTQYAQDRGGYREENPHPVVAVVRHREGRQDTVRAAWAAGGRTRGGTCALSYDEYAVGGTAQRDPPPADDWPRASWLDSLDTWGVECRGDRLRRATAASRLQRTGPVCVSMRGGGMRCGLAAVGAPPDAVPQR